MILISTWGGKQSAPQYTPKGWNAKKTGRSSTAISSRISARTQYDKLVTVCDIQRKQNTSISTWGQYIHIMSLKTDFIAGSPRKHCDTARRGSAKCWWLPSTPQRADYKSNSKPSRHQITWGLQRFIVELLLQRNLAFNLGDKTQFRNYT